MWVKICGITRYEDAFEAVRLGVDAIGFVLTVSPRRADPAVLKGWIDKIQGVEKVGVFTTEEPQLIMDLGQALGLDTIQLHGDFTLAHHILAERFGIIRAVRDVELQIKIDLQSVIGVGTTGESPRRLMPGSQVYRVLIDNSMGSGTTGRWEPLEFPFILAGGLNPDNVREAIDKAHPAGVDVSSGVEISPGAKDAGLMERFIKEART
jgi:phosphoribosylanthranilate isomerase